MPLSDAYSTGTRLAKFIADAGYCSRRQASRLIEAGAVQVNGRPANHIDHVSTADQICIAGEALTIQTHRVCYLYHKPVGVDCNLNPDNKASLWHVLQQLPVRVYPAGRLDKDSRGLLLLTNDGQLCQQLMHPDGWHSKTYRVTVNRAIDAAFLLAMSAGVTLTEGVTRACKIQLVSEMQFELRLTQGWNRQIRRMCKALGYHVTDLCRVAIGDVPLASLAPEQMVLLPEAQWPHLLVNATQTPEN